MRYPIITQKDFTVKEMAARIDHSLLVPYATQNDVRSFIEEVKKYGFKIACLNNSYTELGVKLLEGYDAKVATVIAFPFGALTPDNKALEVENAIKLGAGTVDMVINIGAIKSADWDLAYRDMATCAERAHKFGVTIKAIIETCYLTREEKIKACEIAVKANMDFVKTSTGFGVSGYNSLGWLGDIKLMKDVVGDRLGVKAAGPIPDYETACALIHTGAERVGSRVGVNILKGCPDWSDYADL